MDNQAQHPHNLKLKRRNNSSNDFIVKSGVAYIHVNLEAFQSFILTFDDLCIPYTERKNIIDVLEKRELIGYDPPKIKLTMNYNTIQN